MKGFFDDTCEKCHKRFGWTGDYKNKPPCPSCRHQNIVSKNDIKEIEKFEKFLMDKAEQEDEERKRNLNLSNQEVEDIVLSYCIALEDKDEKELKRIQKIGKNNPKVVERCEEVRRLLKL